jgi:hypothetical protein
MRTTPRWSINVAVLFMSADIIFKEQESLKGELQKISSILKDKYNIQSFFLIGKVGMKLVDLELYKERSILCCKDFILGHDSKRFSNNK